jgi:hypothetical protein
MMEDDSFSRNFLVARNFPLQDISSNFQLSYRRIPHFCTSFYPTAQFRVPSQY